MKSRPEPGFLALETGETFRGLFLGGAERAGELVFNTSHSGYEEMATDPSYFNQILVMTAPQQGNYGADDSVWESRKLHIQGLICLEMQGGENSFWRNKLIAHGVPVLSGVDTRSVVLRLRTKGSVWGAVVCSEDPAGARKTAKAFIQARKKMEKDWPFIVADKNIRELKGEKAQGPKIAVMDFGCKENILKELLQRASLVRVFPPRTKAEEILNWNPSALLLSNGPGDPAEVKHSLEIIKELKGKLFIFGICMGHQLLALALGGATYKLKFGHRGSNHPVKDKLLDKIYVTSQNHGYAVEEKSLPKDIEITHINLNDHTVEGFFSKKHRCMGVQFHPESSPGPNCSNDLFDFFTQQIQ